MDDLVQKACELYQHTACFSVETILTGTVWLEETHRKSPDSKVALAIALHYLLLALRADGALGIEARPRILRRRGPLASTRLGRSPARPTGKLPVDNNSPGSQKTRSKIMNPGSLEKRWEVTLGPEPLIHVHYATASQEVMSNGFKGLAQELREVADQLEAVAYAVEQKINRGSEGGRTPFNECRSADKTLAP
jgi:hypothetical protein